jgi:CheY-like chemotaxis protein
MCFKNVLLVEDYPSLQTTISDVIKGMCGKEAVVLVAGTLPDAFDQWNRCKEVLDLIFLDTSLGHGVTTFDLAREISRSFKGPLVATSLEDEHRLEMVRCGCTHHCPKLGILELLSHLIEQKKRELEANFR